jgi:peptidoglycan/xylan/chitin deacetylase (PgdA/CDA1 family)
MAFEDRVLWKIERRLARILNRREARIRSDTGIVSFTFDDVPRSACHEGSAALEQHGFRGTYYICPGFTGEPSSCGMMHSRADLQRLIATGHEIASHGFGHLNYQSLTEAEIEADLLRAAEFFSRLAPELRVRNFAYPFGCTNPLVKRIICHHFASARGARARLNGNRIDLALLNAVPLYQHLWDARSLARLIATNSDHKSWLIFVTHEVTDHPDEFGCTPALLKFAVTESKRLGCQVLPVDDALAYVNPLR